MTNNPNVSVGIMSAPSIRFSFNTAYMRGAEAVEAAPSGETATATALGIRWRGHLYHVLLFTPLEARDASFSLHDVTIGKGFHWQRQQVQTFRGALLIVKQGAGLVAINILPVETYLESVISSEMSATASLEFLKAHAVISRSWLMAQIQRRAQSMSPARSLRPMGPSELRADGVLLRWYDHEDHTLFDVCADDHCQRYQGISRMGGTEACEAVSQTRGQVLMYGGEICDTRFSKCCGGFTELYSSCWEDTDKPYLVGKPDIIENDARARGVDQAFCNTSDPAILSQVLNNFDQETTDFYRWHVAYTRETVSRLVADKSGLDLGGVLSLRPIERGPSGRIVRLEIVGTCQSVVVGKELEIRKWLSPTHLYSSAFDVEQTPEGFVLHGRGWGHGVGLCQIGAAVMGELGFAYDEILAHYYPNAALADIYE